MSKSIVSQEQFEKNFREHLDYFYECHVGVNSQIIMKYKDCSAEGHWLEFSHIVTEGELNPMGNIHGGITAWLLDTAMGMLNVALIDQGVSPTISLQLNYLEAVPLGSEMIVHAHIDRIGAHIIFNSGEITVDGKPIANSRGTYMRLTSSK